MVLAKSTNLVIPSKQQEWHILTRQSKQTVLISIESDPLPSLSDIFCTNDWQSPPGVRLKFLQRAMMSSFPSGNSMSISIESLSALHLVSSIQSSLSDPLHSGFLRDIMPMAVLWITEAKFKFLLKKSKPIFCDATYIYKNWIWAFHFLSCTAASASCWFWIVYLFEWGQSQQSKQM